MPKILPIEQDYGKFTPPLSQDDDDEVVTLPPLSDEVIENADGSATIPEAENDEGGETEFMANLAETLEPSVLNALSIDLIGLIGRDKDARKQRDKQYAEGIQRTGLGSEAPGGADFEGASKAVHPILAEGCIDFAARAMKEIFPASGPVKTQVIGEQTEEKLAKAERKKTYMNWQLTTQIKEYRAELNQLLTQLPLGGSQYLKIWHDDRYERPRAEFVPVDDMYLPFAAGSFQMAHRATHAQLVTRSAFEHRVASGLYRDLTLSDPPTFADASSSENASNKIEGKTDEMSYNEDGLRLIYEIYVDYAVEDDDPAPYIITIDESTRKVLAVYRNWEEDDEKREKLDWIVDWSFIVWRGAYAIGLPHLIGSLSGALTGALRAILDSAHVNNTPSALKLKGTRVSGQNIAPEIGQISEITGPAGTVDIRQLVMPMPFNPPSMVLFQLLDWIVGQAKGVVATAEESIADASNQMPVGTALALIEQGSQVFSAIHAGLHHSQKRVLAILHRINGVYMDDEVTVEELGELVVRREDFTGPMDIIPVSDPNVFSEAQRYAQLQAVLQLAEKFPNLYKAGKLNMRALRLLNFPDPDDVLEVPKEPEHLDPVSENKVAAEGTQPLKAYDDQDHIAHLGIHIAFLSSPLFCLNPLMANPTLPALLAHCKDHLILQYEKHARAAMMAGSEVQGNDGTDHAIALADKALATQLGPLMDHLQEAMKQQSQLIPPPPPQDPQAAVALQVGMAEVQRKTAVDQANQQAAQTKDQQDQQAAAEEAQREQVQGQADLAKQEQVAQIQASNDARDAAREQANDERQAMLDHMQQQTDNERQARSDHLDMVSELLRNANDNHTKVLIAEMNNTKQAIDDSNSQFQLRIQQLVEQLSAPDDQPGLLQRVKQFFQPQQGE